MTELSSCSHGLLTVLWIGTAIALIVVTLMLYSILSFRRPPVSGIATFVHRTAVEVVWAMIPILILIITAMPAVNTLLVIEASCSSAGG